jgi:Na+/melibiose symporter-like transporter
MSKKIGKFFDIRKRNKQLLFIVLVFFLVSFVIVHLYSLNFTRYVYIKGYHIHHFYFGTVSLALGGILGILSTGRQKLKIASALIGTGIGLFADEIGLLLNCTSDNRVCSYYFPDTTDIILTITVIIVFLIAIADWSDLKEVETVKEQN